MAEYVCACENAFVLKPASLTFETVAAIPQAAVVALQGLRNKVEIQPGQQVLINGAGGGAGTYAVQFAKLFGAEVTGVDSHRKLDMLRSFGADQVIDYTQEDFIQNGQMYDLILDLVARRPIFDCKRALSPNGVYVAAGGSMVAILQAMFLGVLISTTGSKKMGLLAVNQNQKDLNFVKELVETGQVKPVIDRCYPLSQSPEALQYLGNGLALGKVVITLEHSGQSNKSTSKDSAADAQTEHP